jgi:hypothetical protein
MEKPYPSGFYETAVPFTARQKPCPIRGDQITQAPQPGQKDEIERTNIEWVFRPLCSYTAGSS